MTAQILKFPARSKPRPVLKVPTTDSIVSLWAELHCRIAAAWCNPCEHNLEMLKSAQKRWEAALEEKNYPA